MAIELRENTMAQLLAAFRERYRNAQKDDVGRLAAWLRYHLGINDIDEQAMRAAFGLTQSQWNALLKRMEKVADAYAIVQDARGE
jgi:hypothetical protein